MKVSSLLLRHFDGIRAGLGRDEVFIDFTSLPSGLIVFDALNGMGKTTILDNMHPYRLMPYRASSYSPDAFSYYDHTYGEARKEVHFSMAGRDYKQVLTVDNGRRKQECYLYVNDDGRWRALNPDGGTRTYDRTIEEVMGTPKMFFTSIFRCQDAVTISESSKKDMKEVFAELLNSDGTLVLGKKAMDVAARLFAHLEGLRRESAPLEKSVSQKEASEKELQTTIASLSFTARDIDALEEEKREKDRELASIDTELALRVDKAKTKERLLSEMEQKRTAYAGIETAGAAREAAYEKKRAALQEKVKALRRTIEAALGLGNADDNEEILDETVKNLSASITLCDTRYVKTNRRLAQQAEYEKTVKKSEMQLERIRANRDHAITMAESALQNMKEKAARLSSTPCSQVEGNSFSSTCLFLEDARAASEAIPAKEEELAALRTKKDPDEERLVAEIVELRKKCDDGPAIEAEAKGILSLKESLEKKKEEAEGKLRALRKHAAALIEKGLAEKELPERLAELSALTAEKDEYVAGSEQEKERISREIDAIEREASAIVLDEELPKRREDLAREVDRIGPSIEEKRRTEGELKKRSGILEETLRQIASAETRLADIAQELEFYNGEISEWRTLAKSLGNDGIIPLEIADAGPAVTSVANELLRVYDSRYSVRLSTQEATKDSKSTKDVFEIMVLDSLTDQVVSLKLMSGGQRTWIEDAVTKAICIYNKLANGREFETIFTDEKDGALDLGKKRAYFAMKRRVLELGGYAQEFCITQTPELRALADAVITLKDGAITLSAN